MVLLLAGYQIYEFIICFFELRSRLIVYFALVNISFLPPFGLTLALIVYGIKDKLTLVLPFIPFIFFTIYFALNIKLIAVTECTILYAAYNYPFGLVYGFSYFFLIYFAMYFLLLLLSYLNEKKKEKKKLILILLIGFVLTFVPINVLFMSSRIYAGLVESLQCKVAFVLAIAFTYFGLKNQNIVKGIEKSFKTD